MIPDEGWVSAGMLLDAEELEALRAELDAWAPSAPASDYGLLFNNLWRVLPGFRRLVEDGRIASRVMELLETPEVVLFQDNLVGKLPGNLTEIQWHQDYSYWPLDRPAGLTTWLALDDADETNGAMHFVTGSHLLGERAPADFIRGTGQPAIAGLEPMDPDSRPQTVARARAGELLCHHPFAWHRSGPNRSDRLRRAWTATWILPDVRWKPDHAPHPFAWSLFPTDGTPVAGELFARFSHSRIGSPGTTRAE